MTMHDSSVFVVIHFKKTWDVQGIACNKFKRQEKLCENCLYNISRENERAKEKGSSWDLVIVEEQIHIGASLECASCNARRMP